MARMQKKSLTSLVVIPALSLVVAVGCAPIGSSSVNDESNPTGDSSGVLGDGQNSNGSVPKGSESTDSTSPTGSTPNVSGPSGNQSPSVGANNTLALSVLERIVQENEVGNGYVRELFRHWTDADGDRCNTREEVLIAESLTRAQVDPYGCTVIAGDWLSLFDGRAHTDPSDLDIDHLIPLKEAWDSGAHAWSPSQRERFANDLSDGRALIAVTSGVNRSKGDRDPSQWLPPSTAYTCTYISDWIAVKYQWGLNMDSSEWGRLKNLLKGQCAGTTIAPWGTVSNSAGPVSPPAQNDPPPTVPRSSTSSTPPKDPPPSDQTPVLPTIRPGAYCTPVGALGTYSARVYVCAKTRTTGEPYSDGRARWRQQ